MDIRDPHLGPGKIWKGCDDTNVVYRLRAVKGALRTARIGVIACYMVRMLGYAVGANSLTSAMRMYPQMTWRRSTTSDFLKRPRRHWTMPMCRRRTGY
jgi:hypothetical protein